jgi:hypothetical protein
MRCFLLALLLLTSFSVFSQDYGIITGNVLDEKNKALEGATVQLIPFTDSLRTKNTVTDRDGGFTIENISFGYYRLKLSYVGFQPVTIDSMHFRAERFDFNMNDIVLKAKNSDSGSMEEIVIYAEKPLIQSKEGNITFNAGESALSASSNASDLLTNVPLVTKDPNGKVLVRGKEPKILIDDKPVELNQQQLQDLLESMPGSMIEKIEVMTNPPAQYANEQGGVINIVTKKGRVGISGRATVYAGTRGEVGANGNFNYRKQGFSFNINAGAAYNEFIAEGYSIRQNIYLDSANFFNTNSGSNNKNLRPNLRFNADYELNKRNNLNLTLNFNQNDFDNLSETEYRNINRLEELYRLSERYINSTGGNRNFNSNVSYTHKTKNPGETIRLIASYNRSFSENGRDFYQQFFNPDATPNGKDSLQKQLNENRSNGYNIRLNYDVLLKNKKTSVSAGSFFNTTQSDIIVDATYLDKTSSSWKTLDALVNDFMFKQDVSNLKGSLKQILGENFSTTAGVSVEHTKIHFDLHKTASDTSNSYWSLLPFATINKNWKEKLNLTFSYRRTIRRPGINELNPTVDFSDPYNIRFGNPGLLASLADNFDLVLGKNKNSKFYINLGLGYNVVDDIFSQVRTLLQDGKTEVTWQNISGRKEYEISTWSGYTLSKKTRINFSSSYTYNTYGAFDRDVRKFRNGGSFTSNLNGNYNIKDLYSATGSFTFNRFANPQGRVRSNVSMNVGLQGKFIDKKMVVTLNIIDPFTQQQNRNFTYGNNFVLESFNSTQTRNYRLSVAYNFNNNPKKKKPTATTEKNKEQLKKMMQQQAPANQL